MSVSTVLLLAVLSIWDYPERQPRHEALRNNYIKAGQTDNLLALESAALEGSELLPDDPTWRYNLACARARRGKKDAALNDLEKSVRLGYRDVEAILSDEDFAPYREETRFKDIIALAKRSANDRILFGPLATLPAKVNMGGSFALGAQNMLWDFNAGCFSAILEITGHGSGGNAGDLYFNRDGGHSLLAVTNYLGLTRVTLDSDGRKRGMDLDFPNTFFPCPVFGNCSRALTQGPYWRSLPRALLTQESSRLNLMCRFYLSNQIWVYPIVHDGPPLGVRGDLFASVAPYWIATQGRSWSDQYYLRAALEVSRSLKVDTKIRAVAKGLLAPTIQTIIRKSLRSVKTDEDYLTSKAHPTAFPANFLDWDRLVKISAALEPDAIAPVAKIAGVAISKTDYKGRLPEVTYATPCAWAFILRGPEADRSFVVQVVGGEEYAFAVVHDELGAAKVETLCADRAKISIDKTRLTPTNRVDVAIFAKSAASDWGAPSFLSFSVVEPIGEYYDPILTGIPPPTVPVPPVPPPPAQAVTNDVKAVKK